MELELTRTSIQIKHVPERTHAILRHRAAAAHQSLQEYLLHKLVADADMRSVNEVLDGVDRRSGGSVTFAEAADLVRADRDRR